MKISSNSKRDRDEGLLTHLCGHDGFVSSLVFADPNTVLTCGGKDGRVKLFNVNNQGSTTCVASLVAGEAKGSAVLLASGGIICAAAQTHVKLWDLKTRNAVASFDDHSDAVTCLGSCPTGQYMYVGLSDGHLISYDIHAKKRVCAVRAHSHSISSVSLSWDGSFLLTASTDMKMKMFVIDFNTGTISFHKTYFGHTGAVTAVCVSPSDPNIAATASGDKTVRLWQLTSSLEEEESWKLEGHTKWVNAVTFSTSGTVLASCSCDSDIRVWSSTTGACLFVLHGHKDFVLDLAFSQDGTLLASASRRATKIWNLSETGHIVPPDAYRELMSLPHAVCPPIERGRKTSWFERIVKTLASAIRHALTSLRSRFARIHPDKKRAPTSSSDADVASSTSSTKENAASDAEIVPTSGSRANVEIVKSERQEQEQKKTTAALFSPFGRRREDKATKFEFDIGHYVEADYLYSGSYELARVMQHQEEDGTYVIKYLRGQLLKNVKPKFLRKVDKESKEFQKLLRLATSGEKRKRKKSEKAPATEGGEKKSFLLSLMARRE